jgi:hypothetical protein
MLGPNLIRNSDCILAAQEWGQGSLGPDDWISFNGDGLFASQQGLITEPGDYKLILIYESDGWFRAKVGDAAHQSFPAGEGVLALDFTVTNPELDGISFDDREVAAGRVLRAELRKIL